MYVKEVELSFWKGSVCLSAGICSSPPFSTCRLGVDLPGVTSIAKDGHT